MNSTHRISLASIFIFTLALLGMAQPAQAATDSLWSTATTPANANEPDSSSVELGVKFTSSVSGTVSAIRFYKGAQNTGTHTVSLWSSGGTKLATAASTSETASGWQTVTLSAPVSITAGTTYVASYHTPGYYADNLNYFTPAYSNSPLSAPIGAGVYAYGTTSAFPNSTWNNSNYWVDIVFNPASVAVNGACGSSNGADLTSAPTTNLCTTGTASAVSGSGPWAWSCAGSNGGTTAQCQALLLINGACGSANGVAVSSAPTSGLCTKGLASALSGAGPWTWSCAGSNGGTTASCSAPLLAQTKDSLWSTSVTPANVDEPDNSPVELGVQFTSSVNGTVSAIRFYKGPTNAGPHTVSLWSSTGALLATASSSNETASGWQTVNLTTPVSITAATTYVASYHTPGYYSDNLNYFTTAYSNSPLSAPVGAGVYAYGASTVFPNSSWNNSNYWIDILMTPSSGGGGGTPVNGSCGPANGVAVSIAPTANLCSAGTASAVTGSGPWAWSCLGSNGGTTASCSAPLTQQTINGACGTANGVAVSSAPTTNLCSAGTASAVTGSGPWAWSCAGSNGGTTASCSAPLTSSAVNGQCGSMNGVTTNVAPTTGLCSAGTASAVSGTGPWTWSCAGSNGGTTASCEAFTPTSAQKPGPSQALFNNPYYTCNQNWYVSTTGSDTTGNGTSGSPWATLNHAVNGVTISGTGSWCVNVVPGTYSANASYAGFGKGGTTASSTGYLVLRCQTLDGCTLNGNSNTTLAVASSPNSPGHHIIIDGFKMVGEVPQTSGIGVAVAAWDGGNGTCNGTVDCVFATHHIWVLNSIISGFSQSGLQSNDGEYYFAVHNEIFNSAQSNSCSVYGSGISFAGLKVGTGYSPTADDLSNPVLGNISPYHIAAEWNVIHNNDEICGTQTSAGGTDSNGITFDTNSNYYNSYGWYAPRSLVAFNIIYNNGGAGVWNNTSAHIDTVNNSCYNNTLVIAGTARPCLGTQSAFDNHYYNNLSYAIVGSTFPFNSNNAFQLDCNGGTPCDTASNNVTYCTAAPATAGCEQGYNGASYSCTSNKCTSTANKSMWVNVGNTSPGSTTNPPVGANFALPANSPAIGYGLTEPYLPASAIDAGACSSALTTCP
jgi:hypothetical protein